MDAKNANDLNEPLDKDRPAAASGHGRDAQADFVARNPDTDRPAAASPHGPDGTAPSEPTRAPGPPAPPRRADIGGGGALGLVTWAWRTIVVLACVTLVLVIAAVGNRPAPRNSPAPAEPPRLAPEDLPGPLRIPEEDLRRLLLSRVQGCLCADGRLGVERAEEALHQRIQAEFGPLYSTNVPDFLDWHYSVAGQYTELALAARGRLELEIESRLFGDLNERIEQASDAIATTQEAEVRAVLARCVADEVQLVDYDRETRVLRERMLNEAVGDTLRRVTTSAGVSGFGAIGTGLAGGLLVKALAKKLLASIAVKTTGKTAAKAAGSWKAAAVLAAPLSALGPLGTLVGGVAGAAGGWLAVDFLAVKIDERWNRDNLEQELVDLIDERRAEVVASMSASIEARSRAFDAVCLPGALDRDDLERVGTVTPAEITANR